MSFDDIIVVIIVIIGPLIIMFGSLAWYLWDKYCLLPWEEEKDKKADEIYENIQRKRKADRAYQTYATLMDAGLEDSLNSILKGKNYDDFIDTLNTLQDYINTTSCSCDEFTDALNALETPSTEKVETLKQKEPQVIFEPKVMIIEPQGQKPIKIASENIISIKQDDEINPLDEWYEKFMEEIKLG